MYENYSHGEYFKKLEILKEKASEDKLNEIFGDQDFIKDKITLSLIKFTKFKYRAYKFYKHLFYFSFAPLAFYTVILPITNEPVTVLSGAISTTFIYGLNEARHIYFKYRAVEEGSIAVNHWEAKTKEPI